VPRRAGGRLGLSLGVLLGQSVALRLIPTLLAGTVPVAAAAVAPAALITEP
jgi:hypothetical protein